MFVADVDPQELWRRHQRRSRWENLGYGAMVVVGWSVLAVFFPGRFLFVSVVLGAILIVGLFYVVRTTRREAGAPIDSPTFELATVSSLSNSDVAIDMAFNGRLPTSNSEPQGQLDLRPNGVSWAPGKMSSRRGAQPFVIPRSEIESVSLFRAWNTAALFVVFEDEVTAFVFPRPALARLERQVLASGFPLGGPLRTDF